MSGAADAATELRTAALARYGDLRHAVDQASKAVLALRAAVDMMDVLREADRFSLACEELSEIAHAMHVGADKAITACMSRTGCPAFQGVAGNVYTRRNPATVEIADEAAVPDQYLSTPKPKPDRAKIRAAVQADKSINWATLREGGVSLSRRAIT